MTRRLILLTLTTAGLLAAQRYVFTNIADSSDERFTSFAEATAINNNGRVAFGATVPSRRVGVYTGDGGPLTTIFPPSERTVASVPSINEAGMVALTANDPARGVILGVYNGDGGPLQTVFEMTDNVADLEFGLDLTSTVSINNAGDTSFAVIAEKGTAIMLGRPGSLRPAAYSVQEPAESVLIGTALNENGRVAYGRLFPPSYLTARDGVVTVVSDEDSGTRVVPLVAPRPAINDRGAVAFLDVRNETVVIVVSQDGQERIAADILAAYEDVGAIALNNEGTVAFAARPNRFTSGIYTGPDPVTSKVIEEGDSLFGGRASEIRLAQFNTEFLNDSGQIAFRYRMRHPERGDVQGIAVATPGDALPVLSEGAIVNAASFTPPDDPGGQPAAGSMVSIYGAEFARKLTIAAGSPLPTTLDGVTVEFDGVAAPLFFTSAGQINAQVPFEITERETRVRVVTENGPSETRTLPLAPYSPAVYTLSQNGSGQGVVVFASTGAVAGPLGAAPDSQPARAGDVLTIYANGLGRVDPPIASGRNSCEPDGVCSSDFSNLVVRNVLARPRITVGGVRVPDQDVLFAGLTPQFVGLYQINFILPAGIEPGDDRALVVSQQPDSRFGGSSREDVTIAVRP